MEKWEAILLKVETNKGDALRATVRYERSVDGVTDETKTFVREDHIAANMVFLKRQVRGQINHLGFLTEGFNTFVMGPIDMTEGPEEIAKAEMRSFAEKLAVYRRMERAVELGVMTGQEAEMQNLLQELKDDFKQDFLNAL